MQDRIVIMREAVVKITRMLSGKGIEVTQRGTRAYVQADASGRPVRVNLPYIPDNAADELLNAIQGFLDHEVAHILFSDFGLLTTSKRLGVKNLHNIIEDSYIERAMAKKFQGTAHNLANTARFFLKSYTQPEFEKFLAAGDANGVVGVLMVPAIRAWAGQHAYQEYMADKWEYLADIANRLGDLVNEVPLCNSTKDTLQLAVKFKEAMNRKDEEPEPPEDGQPEGEGKDGSDAKSDKKDEQDGGSKGEGTSEADESESKDEGEQQGQSESDAEDNVENDERDPGSETDESGSESSPDEEQGENEGDDAQDAPEGSDASGAGEEGQDEDVEPAEEESDGAESEGGSGEGKDGEHEEAADSFSGDKINGEADPEGESEASEQEAADGNPTGEAGDVPTDEGFPDDIQDTADEREPFDFDDLEEKLGEQDFDEKLSEKISEDAAATTALAPYAIYTKDHDRIEPLPVPNYHYEQRMLDKLEEETRHMTGPLQKDLERSIAAKSVSHFQPGLRRGRINPSALARLTTVQDDRAFRKKIVHQSKDVAVELVVDCSGSMRGSPIRTAMAAAYALAGCLDRIGISSEVIGFTTGNVEDARSIREEQTKMGRQFSRVESLYVPIFKGFGERMTPDVKKRFAYLPYANILANNVDGECIEIAAQRLMQRRETGKVMIVLSDGEPCADGDYRAQDKHLKDVVQKMTKAGINVIGLGIESGAVRRYYPQHIVVNNLAELPTTVMKELKTMLLKSAA